MQLAVRTRGRKLDYEWIGSGSFQSIGATLNDSIPGFVIRKNDNGQCDVLIGCIDRPGKTDYRDRQITMQVFIGGIEEGEARSIAVTILQNWNACKLLADTVTDIPDADDKKREWDIDWPKLERLLKPLMEQSLPTRPLNSAWEGDYHAQKQELVKSLQNCTLSEGPGQKIYWGGSPNTSAIYERLQAEADRLYWKGGERKELHRLPQQVKGEPEVSKKVMWGMMAVIVLLLFTTVLIFQQYNTMKESFSSLRKQNNTLQMEHSTLLKEHNTLQTQYQLMEQDLKKQKETLKNTTDLLKELQKRQSLPQ